MSSIYTEVYKSRKYNHFSRAAERFRRKFANFAQDMRGTRPTGRRCAAENALTEIMSHRILLVDDEPDILEFVKYTLVKEGYEVFTAQNGAEALKAAAQHGG